MKPFLAEVAEDLIQQVQDDLQHCAIIFNNKRPAVYLQKHLAALINKPFWSPTFYTIQEFFAKSTSLKIADFYAQFFSLHSVYNDLLAKEHGGYIDMAKFFPIAKIILSDFAQVDHDLVDPEKLFKELEDIALIDQQFDYLSAEQHQFLMQFWTSYSEGKHKKQQENFIKMWRRMPLLYTEFHRSLAQKGLITHAQAARQLAEGKADHADFITEFKAGKLIFVGFNALNLSEAQLFKQWQDQGLTRFYFDSDSYFLNDPLQEAGLFLRKNIDRFGLINALDNQRSFMRAQQRPVSVYKVEGHNAQAKILNIILESDDKEDKDQEAKEAKDEAAKDQEKDSKTVIVLADETLLLPTLQTIPSEDKLPKVNINVTMGISYISSTLFGLADLWLTTQGHLSALPQENGYSVTASMVENFLTHPLIGISERKRAQILTAFIKENLIQVPIERLTRQGGLFSDFFTPVTEPLALIKALKQLLEAVLRKQLKATQLKKIDADLFIKTIEELNRLYDTLLLATAQLNAESLQPKFIISLIQKALQGISVPLSGDPLYGIQVMGLLETRNLNYEHIVVLGMNDGIIPKTTLGNTFIPDSLRRVYGLPVLENLDAISAYMFYRLVQRAEKVSLVYNSLTDESNSGEPSRFLKQLEYESGFDFSYYEQDLQIEVEQKQEISIAKTPEIMQELTKFLQGQRTLSASALSCYIANPIDFYYKYIAGVKEPEELSEVVEANSLGTILHAVMETFYAELKQKSAIISKDSIQKERGSIPALIAKHFQLEIYKNEQAARSFKGIQQVVIAIIQEYIDIILKHDMETAPFQIIQLEDKLTANFDFTTYDGQPAQITLQGTIDRVDITSDQVTRIVDYKTGGDQLSYSTIEGIFDSHGKKQNKALLQTLFYTYVYEKSKNKKFVEPNLYVVRSMKGNKEDVYFGCKRHVMDDTGKEKRTALLLRGDFLAAEKTIFQELLATALAELFNPHINFYKSENEENYKYSPYKELMYR
ncbi:PD-(D/E)XK nuclease family protein [Sphingobacteriaceae bacterium WQ 2009]|uniref:PD-(D/E)XK nuclease family protein n=1 Tax=Rhinopithecimicrobium faecis TaxID=2820698 RepID=A0A8T4HCJ9_9SPHI|nr:PD-(D/E)XK nuclease family protein [Sphingobacteriaceae bacterium WQ 2009]